MVGLGALSVLEQADLGEKSSGPAEAFLCAGHVPVCEPDLFVGKGERRKHKKKHISLRA